MSCSGVCYIALSGSLLSLPGCLLSCSGVSYLWNLLSRPTREYVIRSETYYITRKPSSVLAAKPDLLGTRKPSSALAAKPDLLGTHKPSQTYSALVSPVPHWPLSPTCSALVSPVPHWPLSPTCTVRHIKSNLRWHSSAYKVQPSLAQFGILSPTFVGTARHIKSNLRWHSSAY
ncbi:hypothetical protein F511_42271 [Dorcoceras hygrometricum]|uniref:Uncharacterized protein n=1 Tax=Dorcoceras hygrometricum TaxID=472368 RepID=A0A2Z7BBP1_9LAMI|nr:hypothetical protein F511_42271 [Dorcoceras hygrometricum]